MSDSYQGLEPENRGGCLIAAIFGIVTLFFDLGRVMGNPAPGTENLWWRHIPPLLPTLGVIALTFFISRALIRGSQSDHH